MRRETWMLEITAPVPVPGDVSHEKTGFPAECCEVSCDQAPTVFTIARVGPVQSILAWCPEHGKAVDEVFE
jgi:hypothetical protein